MFTEIIHAKIKVGLIYDVRGQGDLSFCDAAYTGAKKLLTNGILNSPSLTLHKAPSPKWHYAVSLN